MTDGTKTTETHQTDTSLHIVSDDYAWSECSECGNTIKFGEGPHTVCPACGSRHQADRSTSTVTCTFVPDAVDDEEYWDDQDADLDY